MRIPFLIAAALLPMGAQAQPDAEASPYVSCRDMMHFNALNVTVTRQEDGVHLRLDGFSAGAAAHRLGAAPTQAAAYALEATLPAPWCRFSETTPKIFACELPNWIWPRPTLPARVLDRDGRDMGGVTLSVLNASLERTTRIAAGGSTDITTQNYELSAYAISETDNAKRATLATRYPLNGCR